ncbi:MAG: PhnD/SsuA/transferrin family substrate-binding protein [Roseibium sp.]
MSSLEYRPVRLPMYDWPEVRTETRELEAFLTETLCSELQIAPSRLKAWPDDLPVHDIWTDPGLLVAQTCGYPLTHSLSGKVALVGAPHYKAVGCEGADYCSHLLVAQRSGHQRLSDLRGTTAVFNNPDSQSGMNALRHSIAPLANGEVFFSKVIESRGHLASMQAVADGIAEVAAIDAVCWQLALQEKPEMAGRLRSIGMSAKVPNLPFISSRHHDEETLQKINSAVANVLSDPETEKSRQRLRIGGFSTIDIADYAPILSMESEARDLGYPKLG